MRIFSKMLNFLETKDTKILLLLVEYLANQWILLGIINEQTLQY